MIPIIPISKFKKLINTSISEDSLSKKKFSMDEFSTFIKTQDFGSKRQFEIPLGIIEFMKETNVEFIGQGSSRLAFFIPEGSLADKSAPCCLKVSKNNAGCAQTCAELELFHQYNLACFPKMFDFDSSGKYIITEVGTKLTNSFMEKYTDEWNINVLKLNRHSKCLINTKYNNRTESVIDFVQQFCEKTAKDVEATGYSNEYFLDGIYKNVYNKIINPIATKFKKFMPLKDLIEFSKKSGFEIVIPTDLKFSENWAVIKRNNTLIPIPIDWGFTEDVYTEYYN